MQAVHKKLKKALLSLAKTEEEFPLQVIIGGKFGTIGPEKVHLIDPDVKQSMIARANEFNKPWKKWL